MLKIVEFARKSSIKGKLVFYMTTIILLTGIINLYFYSRVYSSMDEYNKMLQGYSRINTMSMKLIQGRDSMLKYISLGSNSTGEKTELSSYNYNMEQTLSLARDVFDESSSLDTYLLSRAIKNSIDTYSEEVDKVTLMSPEEGYLQFLKARDDSVYIEGYIKQLLDIKLSEGEWYHQMLTKRVDYIRTINIIGVLLLTIFGLVYVVALSNSVTIPIKKLTQFARNISKGDFKSEELKLNSSEDINLLASSLNTMSRNIQDMINMERRLHEEELEKANVANELNKARFLALQSQINPHFLFNTLNAIARFAMFEGAKKTMGLIQSLSNIFGYNLKNSDTVLLQDELKIIEEYAHIQTARFGDRMRFEIKCMSDLTNIWVPSFILQPLVENAVMHGLEAKESGGTVRIKIYDSNGKVIIKVIDNGIGISKEQLQMLFDKERSGSRIKAHTTGIGLNNVKERVALYYRSQDSFKIKSKSNLGTVITLSLARN